MENHPPRDTLSALHDGELTSAERKEVLTHLEECAPCRQFQEHWGHITRALFPAPAPPSPAETSFFVRQVMGQLESPPLPQQIPWRDWLESRWGMPALGLGIAALFLSIVWPHPESIEPPDVVFLMDASHQTVQKLVLPPDSSRADNLLAFLMEDP